MDTPASVENLGFLSWNDAVAGHFFRPENAGRTVFLYVTHETIEEIGRGAGVADFVVALKEGPPWRTRAGLCQAALQAKREWRSRGLRFPPYIGYLALFVLALDVPRFHPNAYYARLRTLLGEEAENGQYNSFNQMLELWDDLELWANEEMAGSLGIVRTDFAGSWMHVGVPAAQAILTATERERLHAIFEEEGLDPEYPPADSELRGVVLANARGALLPRTIKALEDGSSDYSAVLMERIAAELEAWDGAAPEVEETAASGRGQAFLCLNVDPIALRLTAELRCRFGGKTPGRLTLRLHNQEVVCEEAGAFSKPLALPEGKVFDAASLDWTKPATFRDESGAVAVRFPGCDHRVFLSGKERGINGWIETARIDPTRPFLIAAAPSLAERIATWGSSCATAFRERQLSGAPAGWHFFSGDAATEEAGIGAIAPRLSFERQARRVQLTGGIHVPGKTSYFRFAPPKVRLDGPLGEALAMNGVSVPREQDGSYSVPEELLTERLITVTCGTLKRRIFFEDGTLNIAWEPRTHTLDGAVKLGAPAPGFGVAVPALGDPFDAVMLPVGAGTRAEAVGQYPGELAPYTTGAVLPFPPVWVLVHHGRNDIRALYVASELLPPLQRKAEKKAVSAWKDVLWYQRMHITPPKFKTLRDLWAKYRDAAHHA